MEQVYFRSSVDSSTRMNDEEALRWANIERLPTYDRARTSVIKSLVQDHDNDEAFLAHKEVNVKNLDVKDKQEFIERNFRVAEEDNERFLRKLRARIDK